MTPKSNGSLPPEIIAYYQQGKESRRLLNGTGRLEFARTQEFLQRYLPEPPAVLFDVGGGPGLYAAWLARLGYEVHLIDAMPLHIQQAQEVSNLQSDFPVASFAIGDARQVDRETESVDAVLLLGPLYHLTARRERIAALREARRILKPGGRIFSAAISRFAPALDGLTERLLDDPFYLEIVRKDLVEGQHRNPVPERDYFTTAYLHHPEELKPEIEEAGFVVEKILAVECVGWLLPAFEDMWEDPIKRENLLTVIRWLEEERTLLGASVHLLVVASK